MVEPYSAVIRSIGPSPLLTRLLESLCAQTRRPAEVIISIPRDVEPWPVGALGVKFVESERGMVSQRAQGILSATSEHLLLLDDDVALGDTAAEVVMNALESGADCVVPYTTSGWPTGTKRVICALAGIAIPRRRGGVAYTAGGGYRYPLGAPPPGGWPTWGGLGQVLGVNRSFAVEHHTLGDRELERASRYPVREDGAFVLLLAQAGGRCRMIPGVSFEHLGVGPRPGGQPLATRYQAEVENHHLFWKRHIWPAYERSFSRRAWARLLVGCHLAGNCVIAGAASLRGRNAAPLVGVARGVRSILRGTGATPTRPGLAARR